jgi:alpha-glucosidase
MWDQPEVHEVYRRWHKILSEYPGDRMAVAEAWTQSPESMARFVRADEMSQTFNFSWLLAPWSARDFARVIRSTLDELTEVDAAPTWVLSNHDVVRHTTRYGGGPVGLARARAATLTMLALPGSAYLYQGEELGLENVDVPPQARQDPAWFRTQRDWRDGCRVPIPWSGEAPPYGFGPSTGQPWLPQPEDWAALTVAAQEQDAGSTLAFYRSALTARRTHAGGLTEDVELLDAGPDLLAFRRGALTVVLNAGDDAAELPSGETVLASGPLEGELLPPDTAVWLV